MTPDAFKAAGEALWGGRWIAAMARSLHCSTRSVRRWAAGSWPVPDGVEHDVALLLATRQAEIAELARAPATWRRKTLPFVSLYDPRLYDPNDKFPYDQEVYEKVEPEDKPTVKAPSPTGPPRWMIDEERKKLEKGNQ